MSVRVTYGKRLHGAQVQVVAVHVDIVANSERTVIIDILVDPELLGEGVRLRFRLRRPSVLALALRALVLALSFSDATLGVLR